MYKINNGFDFLLEVVFRDISEMEDFLETVDERFKLKAKQVYYIIDDIVRENFMTQPEMIGVLLPTHVPKA
jgi:hypothetical protein